MFTVSPRIQRRELFEKLLTLKKVYPLRGEDDKRMDYANTSTPIFPVDRAERYINMLFAQVIVTEREFQGKSHIYG